MIRQAWGQKLGADRLTAGRFKAAGGHAVSLFM
jgi:hypothetical protein